MQETEILYNGRCPICSAEIAQYRKQAEASDAPLRFTDLNTADLTQWQLSSDQATRRLHVRHEGEIISGFPAFLILWQHLPRLRWLARLLSWPVLQPIARFGYDYLAAPLLHALHKYREKAKTC